MRKILLLIVASVLCLTSAAQYSAQKVGMSVSHMNFPTIPLDDDEFTYHVDMKLCPEMQKYADSKKILSGLDIAPFKEMDSEDDAFLQLIANIMGFGFSAFRAVESPQEDGTVKYMPQVEVTTYYSLRLRTELDNQIFPKSAYVASCNIEKLFATEDEAAEYASTNFADHSDMLVSTFSVWFCDIINDYLGKTYIRKPMGEAINVYLFSETKNPYYKKHQEAKVAIQQIFSDLSENKDLQQARSKMQPWIDYFDKIFNEIGEKSQEQKDAKMMMLCNIVSLNYALDNFDVASQYLDNLKDKYIDCEDIDDFTKKIYNARKMMKEHNLKTRYF